MTPEEREVLERLAPKLEWCKSNDPYNVVIDYNTGRIKYTVQPNRDGTIDAFDHKRFMTSHSTFEEAKAACRTHQLEQVRKIFGDEGMAELLEMFDLYQYVATDMG